ncbi:MAG: recombinase RecA [Anaerolineae bacterium]|nr:recombinase RecA [Anaerolineae bacterium]MCB9103094.1 recombinase RecA [Anaerolineales bacterium]
MAKVQQNNGREKALAVALDDLKKRFGEGTIMRLGDRNELNIETIPTGCLSLDIALGIGGLPKGRIIEIYGPESSGKTTLCQHVIAEAQKQGGVAAFVDVEHALDPTYAEKCGVMIDDLYVSQPDTGEQALEITEALVRSGAVDVVVVDSVAALVPRAEIEGDMGDSHVGLQARLMSQALRKLAGTVKQSDCMLIFTNQLRQKIGVMFGSPETTTGGMALRFYASVRLDIRRIQAIKDSGEVIGNRTKVTVKKNKVAPPFRICEFDIMYNQGISRSGDVLDIAVLENIVDKRGAFYSYGDTRLAQGRENAKTFLEANLDMMLEIENKVREAKGLPIIDPIMTAAAEKVKAEKKAVSKPAPKSKGSSTDKQAAFELEDDDLPTDVDLD